MKHMHYMKCGVSSSLLK